MRALFSDPACKGSNCENDQGQDQQQPQQSVHGDASGNRRHEEDHSENDQNESQRASLRRAYSRLADHFTKAPQARQNLVDGDKGYVITFTTLPSLLDAYADSFVRSADTFRLISR